MEDGSQMATELSRRDVLKIMGGMAGASALAMTGLLSGCAPKAEPTTAPAEPTAAPAKEEATTAPVAAEEPTTFAPTSSGGTVDWTQGMAPVPVKYDQVYECSFEFPGWFKHKEGEDYTNNPMYKWAVDNLKIQYTIHWQADGDVRTTKRQADIAAGTLADMLVTSGSEFVQLIENDAVEEIKQLWDTTASPVNKERRLYPDGMNWLQAWREGRDKLYGVAFQWGPSGNVDNLGFIRKDWLDKVGLGVPDTLDDLDKAIRAFHDQGLCAYGINACKNLVTWYQSLDPVFGAFGVMPTCWRDYGDGKLVYESINPDVKKALEVIRGWYADGLMDPDFFTYAEGDSANLVADQKVGAWYAPHWALGYAINVEKATPGAEVVLFPSVAGPDGKRGRKASRDGGPYMAYKKGLDPKVIECTMNHLNWEVEMNVNGLEKYNAYGAGQTNGLFLETYDWDWATAEDAAADATGWLKEGELKPGQYQTGSGAYRAVGWHFDHMSYPAMTNDIYNTYQKWMAQDGYPDSMNKAQRLLAPPAATRSIAAYKAVFDTMDWQIVDQWFGIATERMIEASTAIGPLESETYVGIVIGNKPIEAFDEFVTAWKSQGGDILTEDINAWYSSVKA